MSGARRFLSFAGADVVPMFVRADGRAVVAFLDRGARPTALIAEAWPHELTGPGWHLSQIKRLLEQLPREAADKAQPAATTPAPNSKPNHRENATRPRGFLSAHYAAAGEDE
jgi:hypothetical protein